MMNWSMLLIAITFSCGASALREKHDSSELYREKRTVEQPAQVSPAGQNNNGGSPTFMSANMQASYFLGQCVMCPPGNPGPRGAPGPQGMPGRDGRDQLILGPLGSEQVLHSLATPEPAGESQPSSAGVTYTRWGRTTCPSTSQLVYHGVMGSSNSVSHKGSGGNYLCLPLEPTYDEETPNYGSGAYVYGVEYNQALHTSRNVVNSEAPCAVCLASNKETAIMVPGTITCLGSQDWTLEYRGTLMSSYFTHYKSEFVCVDQEAEGIPRTNYNNDEATLYVAESLCSSSGGGLPCPPYVSSHDLLCVVCTL